MAEPCRVPNAVSKGFYFWRSFQKKFSSSEAIFFFRGERVVCRKVELQPRERENTFGSFGPAATAAKETARVYPLPKYVHCARETFRRRPLLSPLSVLLISKERKQCRPPQKNGHGRVVKKSVTALFYYSPVPLTPS